ncbi:MAG: Hsp70 family protein [Deltaproteobacteria bacterium]|nr:Hsp70 family protein [Deltaproteobacteria bacterium]
MSETRKARSIGIDLGTTNSCVATIDEKGRPEILENRQGQRTLPSIVHLEGDSRILVGAPAKRQAVTRPKSTFFAMKRLMGRRFHDPEVERLRKALPFEVAEAPSGDAWVRHADRLVSPQEISAHVLFALRDVASERLAHEGPFEAVITVPAYFDEVQRQATKDAAAIAGLTVRRLLNEPTAAALGYGAHKFGGGRLAVCDLGGGTFDVSILNVEDGAFEVIATDGDSALGGDDFDLRVVSHLAAELEVEHGFSVLEDPVALGRLREEAEKAKQALSETAEGSIDIPFLGTVRGARLDYHRVLKRGELESFAADLIERLEGPCLGALAAAGLRPDAISQVLLVGGMTRMPAVARKLENVLGRRAARNTSPDEAVAIGAATQCAILDGHVTDVVLLDVTSRALGIHSGNGKLVPIIPRNATVPTRGSRILTTSGDDQAELAIEVYQGEDVELERNRHLSTVVLGELPKTRAGEVMVLVDFTVDVDGILGISARELGSSVPVSIQVKASSGLPRSDVDRLAKERAASGPIER